jgi:hypothetical protein
MRRSITKSMLRDQIGMTGPRPFFYCRYCDQEYSANRGDYFMLPDSHIFTCCGHPMKLATKTLKYKWVSA